jgi:hypothetical protein
LNCFAERSRAVLASTAGDGAHWDESGTLTATAAMGNMGAEGDGQWGRGVVRLAARMGTLEKFPAP